MTPDTCSAWDPKNCDGTAECPPRCPRFVDKRGEPVLVEPYSPLHFEDLVSMYEGYPDAHRSMGLPPVGRGRIENWLERLLERGFAVVAVHDGRVAGHAAYAPRSSVEPQFLVFVDPAYHDRGIGSECCRQLIAYAADAGHEALVLDVDAENERACHVYRRMGFETVERSGGEIRMRLPFDEPIVETVRLPPAERPASA
ncbi:GNAT family N-acetyltransferase [Natronococcus sp.]|uniref:GNAT family N-acetyltransferase n=1 Tax=Natronococcus sp. TaxID=35747 RepID=UPI003A4D6C55